MRTGACTVQQALTAEAASVLKLSLNLARRRGHAQVTPLHVAATLLSSSSSSSNLLRRACLKSHPHNPASHPLQCRALELCFNVALNRLPTTPPPSSSASLFHSQPSLSNALIAALKRAQAHQRRGCIELQQQQQPLLAIKIELEQLITSILDDPSVSRVMREAGFSSTCVKNNLGEESSVLGQSTPPFFFGSHKEILSQGSFWQSQFLKPSSEINPVYPPSQKEDLRVVLEAMVRKQGRRKNTVVVGDSVSMIEGLVSELMGRVERGEVPDELKPARFIKLQLSYVHLRLMSRGDVDMKVDDLRRKIFSLASDRVGGGVIIYAGNLRWAVDEETKDGQGFRPVEHMIGEVGRLLSELTSSNDNGGGAATNRVLLLATASYQTYMRCQMRRPSLEAQWALQAVVVPSGGLALSLQGQSGQDPRMTTLSQYPFQMLASIPNHHEEEEKLMCCAECASNFEMEASVFKSEKRDTDNVSNHLPIWLQPHRPHSHHKDALPELRRKWNRLCQSLHHGRHNQAHLYPLLVTQGLIAKSCTHHASSHQWWPASLPHNPNKFFVEPHSTSLPENALKLNGGSSRFALQIENGTGSWQERDAAKNWPCEVSLRFVKKPANQEVRTTLALGSPLFSDSATSDDQRRGAMADPQELRQLLEENIPWQSGTIPSIIEALHDRRSSEKKGTWLLIQGNDHIGKRRLARVVAEIFRGSSDRLVQIDMSKLASRGSSCTDIFTEATRKDQKRVVLIEGIERAHPNFIKSMAEGLRNGFSGYEFSREAGLANGFFILITSSSTKFDDDDENPDAVLKMRLSVEESKSPHDLKRRPERELPNKSKKSRTEESGLDLNLCAQEEEVDQGGDEEDGVPSDLTHETDAGDPNLPYGLLESFTTRFTMDASPDRFCRLSESLLSKLHRAFEEVASSGQGTGKLCVDRTAVEELIMASGSFLESLWDKWVREVFRMSLATVKKGGKVRLAVEGKVGNVGELGFQGSALPRRIHVD
ncbi:protein SMAX1-LIKE 4 [Phoenix dactylifera]|uniref:Protein SMAX1-LIKE 4 n=1 Tax=Phoenix dactylifera TaxID=42345 RepID=A0A8B7D259_PHODC|nr:protein SMAX1-LIKE 4 [Phoenix dactylifera]